ncbi:MAG: hypothetical protein SFV54_19665 [Bryobacteraceae bacterium]|nr:hypothetical protein [Bryobacteraceae bacterium]
MTRRFALSLLASAALARADAAAEVREVFASLAAALTERDAPGFFAQFDEDFAGLDALRTNVEAMMDQAEVASSITFPEEPAEAAGRVTSLADWAMNLRSRAAIQRLERRRALVTATFRTAGKRLKIAQLAPLTLFAPPRFTE